MNTEEYETLKKEALIGSELEVRYSLGFVTATSNFEVVDYKDNSISLRDCESKQVGDLPVQNIISYTVRKSVIADNTDSSIEDYSKEDTNNLDDNNVDRQDYIEGCWGDVKLDAPVPPLDLNRILKFFITTGEDVDLLIDAPNSFYIKHKEFLDKNEWDNYNELVLYIYYLSKFLCDEVFSEIEREEYDKCIKEFQGRFYKSVFKIDKCHILFDEFYSLSDIDYSSKDFDDTYKYKLYANLYFLKCIHNHDSMLLALFLYNKMTRPQIVCVIYSIFLKIVKLMVNKIKLEQFNLLLFVKKDLSVFFLNIIEYIDKILFYHKKLVPNVNENFDDLVSSELNSFFYLPICNYFQKSINITKLDELKASLDITEILDKVKLYAIKENTFDNNSKVLDTISYHLKQNRIIFPCDVSEKINSNFLVVWFKLANISQSFKEKICSSLFNIYKGKTLKQIALYQSNSTLDIEDANFVRNSIQLLLREREFASKKILELIEKLKQSSYLNNDNDSFSLKDFSTLINEVSLANEFFNSNTFKKYENYFQINEYIYLQSLLKAFLSLENTLKDNLLFLERKKRLDELSDILSETEKQCSLLLDINFSFKFLALNENFESILFHIVSSYFIRVIEDNYLPKVEVFVDDSNSFWNENQKCLYVPIYVSNDFGCQNALDTNITISVYDDNKNLIADIQYLINGEVIGNGQKIGEIVKIVLGLACKNFTHNYHLFFRIIISYKYRYSGCLFSYDLPRKEQEEIFKEFRNNGFCTQTSKKIIESNHTFILNDDFAIIENIYSQFTSGAAIKSDEMFYGREIDLREIQNKICDENGIPKANRCCLIYGQKRIGKSSILYHVKKNLSTNKYNIIVDIGDIGTLGNSNENLVYAFCYQITRQLKREITRNHKDIKDLIKSKIDPNSIDKDNPTIHFDQIIQELSDELLDIDEQYKIIILIDEFNYLYDWIRQGKISDNIMKFWKAFMANNDVLSILVGQDHILHFIHDPKYENCFGSIDTFRVDYLRKTDALRLIDEPLQIKNVDSNNNIVKDSRFTQEALDMIYDLTAGNAYLIMNFCAKLVDYVNEIRTPYIFPAVIDMFLSEKISECEERWFEPLINDLYVLEDDSIMNKNEEIMKIIAQQTVRQERIATSELKNMINNNKAIDSLINRGVLDVEHGMCKIRVGLYKKFLLNRYGNGVI